MGEQAGWRAGLVLGCMGLLEAFKVLGTHRDPRGAIGACAEEEEGSKACDIRRSLPWQEQQTLGRPKTEEC